MIEFKYRPDIDGLRAVAVSMVLLFHAGLGFPGGYVGVDVFFVISGFLITGLILKEQKAGTFTLANFWMRRIRRIIPAATVMVATVLIAGFFLLLPTDYVELGQSSIAQQLMLSNVYFWRSTGYFSGFAELKPLLHTWSLAVEEQFYIGYPFLIIILSRFRRRNIALFIALLTAVSFATSQYGVEHYPNATYYLLPTRAWELLI
jgi:peptidoglycan/LPS O-acetylase OafA/YrhL